MGRKMGRNGKAQAREEKKIIQHFSADMRAFDITKMVVLCMKFSSTQFFSSSLLLPLLTYEPDNTSLCLIPKQNLPKRAQLKLSNFCFIGSCFVKCTLASIRKGGMKSLWENQVARWVDGTKKEEKKGNSKKRECMNEWKCLHQLMIFMEEESDLGQDFPGMNCTTRWTLRWQKKTQNALENIPGISSNSSFTWLQIFPESHSSSFSSFFPTFQSSKHASFLIKQKCNFIDETEMQFINGGNRMKIFSTSPPKRGKTFLRLDYEWIFLVAFGFFGDAMPFECACEWRRFFFSSNEKKNLKRGEKMCCERKEKEGNEK